MKEFQDLDYFELRKLVSKIIPRLTTLPGSDKHKLKEKGRKSNYRQFNIVDNSMNKIERLLDSENINSFAEVSLRAQSCPMPLNLDSWDGLTCPYRCKYCFPAGTKILMVDGTEKNIERVREGERVMSFNEVTGNIEPAIVEEKLVRDTKDDFIEIETESGISLSMTPEHPVFIRNKGWVKAEDIIETDEVLVW